MSGEAGAVRWPVLAGVGLLVIAVDQLTKALVRARVPLGEGFTVIPGFFDVVHGRNTGVAFGLFAEHPTVFQVLGVAIIPILLLAYRFLPLTRLGRIAWAAIIGGAVGNQIDRLVLGSVTDFIDWYVGSYHWYTFNVADACIVSGVVTIITLDFVSSRSNAEPNGAPSTDATGSL